MYGLIDKLESQVQLVGYQRVFLMWSVLTGWVVWVFIMIVGCSNRGSSTANMIFLFFFFFLSRVVSEDIMNIIYQRTSGTAVVTTRTRCVDL